MFTNDDSYPYLEEVNEGILRHLPPPPSTARPAVLDVGCGQASLGAEIAALGYEVWGIEQDAFAAGKAAERVAKVIQADLTDECDVARQLEGKRFSTIVFSDVLEHVYDPLSVLHGYLRYLEPNGRVLISLPNALNWQTRLSFLAGRFRYQDSGVMDRTHIRFFTFATAQEMVERAGLQVDVVDHTPYVVRAMLPLAKRLMMRRKGDSPSAGPHDPRAIIDSPAYRTYLRFIYPIEYRLSALRPSLLAFRILVSATRSEAADD